MALRCCLRRPDLAPDEIVSTLRRQGFVYLDRPGLTAAIEFWRAKSRIYEQFINREDVILWESAWALALQQCCPGVSLDRSLELAEDELVSAVKGQELPAVSHVIRYKEPQEYVINGALDALPSEMPVSELWRVLRREPVGTSRE